MLALIIKFSLISNAALVGKFCVQMALAVQLKFTTYFKTRYSHFKNTSSSLICLFSFCLGASAVLQLRNIDSVYNLLTLLLFTALMAFKYPVTKPALFAVLGFVWLSFNASQALSHAFPPEFERLDIELQGDVLRLPNKTNNDYRFRFRIDSVEKDEFKTLVGKKIQLSCYRCPMEFSSGQSWHLTVRLKRPHGYASWGAFDYEKYLFRHRLIAKGYVRLKGQNTLLSTKASGPSVWRSRIRHKIHRTIPDSVGRNIILALTIGDKSGFSKEQLSVFQNSGVSHLMAISGLHIGLVFIGIMLLLKWCLWPFAKLYDICPRPYLVLLPAFFCACLYAALAGFAVSTQRALIMLMVFVICRIFARQISLINVLVMAATLLLLIDPFSILDVGFWLSCGAVFIIALMSTGNGSTSLLRLQPFLWLGMLPMTVVFFGKLSFVSPLINFLIVPLFCVVLIPITLVLILLNIIGFSALSAFLLPFIAGVFDVIYSALDAVVAWPYASFFVTPFVWWQWVLIASLAILLIEKFNRIACLVCFLLLASIMLKPAPSLDKGELQIVLLDVGQGLAMVIETEHSISVYDTGPRYSSGFTVAEAVLIPYLHRRGVEKIDNLIISHADNDHIGGYQSVQEAFEVERVFSSRPDKLPEAVLCQEGQFWSSGTTEFVMLGPNASTPTGSNNLSCVLQIKHHDITILLTGDIERQVERYMLTSDSDLNADIMLVPHQGSKTSSTTEFIDAVSPQVALLAAGYKNHYGHPHKSVIERYEKRDINVLSTIESGSIILNVNANGWQAIEYRESEQRFWFD